MSSMLGMASLGLVLAWCPLVCKSAWLGLIWLDLGRSGLTCDGSRRMGLGLGCLGLRWVGLDLVGLETDGLVWLSLAWLGWLGFVGLAWLGLA